MLRGLLKVATIFMIVSMLFFMVSFIDLKTKAQIFAPNTFIPSTLELSQQEKSLINKSLNEPYLENANLNREFDEFTESTIDPDGFYLRIDKINLFKAIVRDVDPRVKNVYVKSWEKGISHGKFTAKPDQIGVTYLYSHAVSNPKKAQSENAWFTYMDDVAIGDEVVIYYSGKKYTYEVSEIHVVNPDATGFYTGASPVKMTRMQFCGPPTGSLSKRTLVDALLIDETPI